MGKETNEDTEAKLFLNDFFIVFGVPRRKIASFEIWSQFPLVDLYDPLTMPPALVKAHNELDKAVDLAYRPQPFTTEANRMEFLFELYEKYTSDLFTKAKVKKIKKR